MGSTSRRAFFQALPVPAQKMVTAYFTFKDGKTADRGNEPQNFRFAVFSRSVEPPYSDDNSKSDEAKLMKLGQHVDFFA